MTTLLKLTCGADGCQSLGEAMHAVAATASFWLVVSVALTIVASTVLYAYHGGDWPKGGSA